jgi:hypothetical protein
MIAFFSEASSIYRWQAFLFQWPRDVIKRERSQLFGWFFATHVRLEWRWSILSRDILARISKKPYISLKPMENRSIARLYPPTEIWKMYMCKFNKTATRLEKDSLGSRACGSLRDCNAAQVMVMRNDNKIDITCFLDKLFKSKDFHAYYYWICSLIFLDWHGGRHASRRKDTPRGTFNQYVVVESMTQFCWNEFDGPVKDLLHLHHKFQSHFLWLERKRESFEPWDTWTF